MDIEFNPRVKRVRSNSGRPVFPKRITYSRAFKSPSVKYLGGLYRTLRGEKKFFDTSTSGNVTSSTGTVLNSSLNLLSAGTGESQVIGRQIVVKSIEFKGRITKRADAEAALADLNSQVDYSVALVLDKQANGAAGTIAQIYESTRPYNPRNLEFSKRFRVLKEWKGAIRSQSGHDGTNYFTDEVGVFVKMYKKCNIVIDFGATPSGAIGDIKSNNLMLVARCESLGTDATPLSVSGVWRITYTE